MKKLLFGVLFALITSVSFAQDLPDNPEPGKCYVRCKTPEVWKKETITIVVSPKYTKLITNPAKYETVNESVIVKEASKKLVIVPAVWRNEEVTYDAKEDFSTLKVTNAKFSQESETVETKPASAVWEMSEKAPDCESDNPDDCRYWCYKPVPAKFETIPVQRLVTDAKSEKIISGGFKKTYLKKVMVSPPTTREVEIPAEYGTITRSVLVEDASYTEVIVPEVTELITQEILVSKGGLTSWKPVDCEITNNTPLPINWDFSSANLNKGAKKIMDSRLLPILKTGVAIVIESHTDMRGTKKDNQTLSDNRARAVVDYLISKGISPSQLTAKGFGESRLKNKCADGVDCNEAQHAANRRTTFRVVNQ